MDKKWYKVTFYAEMDDNDVRAMNKYFYQTMREQMEITPCEGLQIEEEQKKPEGTVCVSEYDYELDLRTGAIKIDKRVRKDFDEGLIIDVCFVDEDNILNQYIMTREDEDWIYCEYYGPGEPGRGAM